MPSASIACNDKSTDTYAHLHYNVLLSSSIRVHIIINKRRTCRTYVFCRKNKLFDINACRHKISLHLHISYYSFLDRVTVTYKGQKGSFYTNCFVIAS